MREGYNKLWSYFGLSRASWLTLPRVMCHAMPDEWQRKMAELMEEWDDTWVNQPDFTPYVNLKQDNKFTKTPEWLLNYRHPNEKVLESMKKYE